jgi:hypothetical protein
MSNQWKTEFVNSDFGIQSFWGGYGKILPKSWLMPKGIVCPELPIQQPGWVPIIVTCWGSIAKSYQTPTGKVNDTQQAKENVMENDVNSCQSNLIPLGVPVRVYL